jgi:hypothetical protein
MQKMAVLFYFAAEARQLGLFFSFLIVVSISTAWAQVCTGKMYTVSPLSAHATCAFTFQFTCHNKF